jgi:hypothetical protein
MARGAAAVVIKLSRCERERAAEKFFAGTFTYMPQPDHVCDLSAKEQSVVILISYVCTSRDIMARGVKKGVSKKKYERTVKKIKKSGGAKNPYAVANAKLGRKGKSTKSKKSKSK